MTEDKRKSINDPDAEFLMEGTEEGIRAFVNELVVPILIERSETERYAVCKEKGGCACAVAFVPCRYRYYDLETGENYAWVPSKGMYEVRKAPE